MPVTSKCTNLPHGSGDVGDIQDHWCHIPLEPYFPDEITAD